MSEFTGMALYTKDEIGRALKSYAKEVHWADNLLQTKTKFAEDNFKPSWWQKLFKITLKDTHMDSWKTYYEHLYDKGYYTFSEEEFKRIKYLNAYKNFYYFGNWRFEDECEQVKNLYDGGKDCYLNPNQSAFVNEWKNKES